MDDVNFNRAPRGVPVFKSRIEEIFRRVSEASLRLEKRAIEARRLGTLSRFDAAVASCVNGSELQSVRDYYLQLKWTVVVEYGNVDQLPSESTFRRRVERARSAFVGLPLPTAAWLNRQETALRADVDAFDGRTFNSVALRSR
ncbi:hypothetical protein ELH22_08700 [Rhizobium ruizarguesonis]|uniref:hypothetical protein n=1 Tax=Rhizobium ruizarguesonis TaxID=2081791 RepID=UPI001030CB06|nr:hypothetical protein [Rhizobium ruizarguesonis]TBD63409.1 hypothetical protein ELH22_08700 [Rhizobium ruizarguesonis]